MDEKIKQYSRDLRKNQTNAEFRLWNSLRNRRFFHLKFKRQFPIDKYIADFCCHEKRLVIELDGGQHNIDEKQKYDDDRTEFFTSKGYKVLRFWNDEIMNNFESVLEAIRLEVE